MKQSPSVSLIDQALAKPSSLYLIASQGKRSLTDHLAQVEAALLGGVDLVQMREKEKSSTDLMDLGERLLALCHSHGVPMVVNDHAQVAVEVHADGLHLGQDDMSPEKAAKELRFRGRIGLSTHTLNQVERAVRCDAVAMLGFGPIFSTNTKDAGPALGACSLQAVLDLVASRPLWAIGGICLENLSGLVTQGCRRVAVSSAIMHAGDPENVAKQMKSLLGALL